MANHTVFENGRVGQTADSKNVKVQISGSERMRMLQKQSHLGLFISKLIFKKLLWNIAIVLRITCSLQMTLTHGWLLFSWSQSLDTNLDKATNSRRTPFRSPFLRKRFGSVDTPSSASKWNSKVQ